jgi:glucose/arabinose dehydrogenase
VRRRVPTLLLLALVVSLFAAGWQAADAAAPAAGFVDNTYASGLSGPTAMAWAPDGRLFVNEQTGAVRVITSAGALLPTPFASFTVDSTGERGLLGIAFDPLFGVSNQFLYVYYTVPGATPHNRVSRLTAGPNNLMVAASELPILDLDNLSSATNHNGGGLHFGADGKLYVSVGENANGANSQTLANRLGKMLRINTDGSIPTDNPFFATATGANRAIWTLGLRNPYTFDFQPGTGRLFINDVGQSAFEEIDDGIAGANYGWPTVEGPSSNPSFVPPLFSYAHPTAGSDPNATGCAITGGAFYNPPAPVQQFPAAYVGKYFFADLCGNWIRLLDPATATSSLFATLVSTPVDLKVGTDGALYYLARGNGIVGRISSVSQLPGAARDIAVGGPGNGTTWAIGVSAIGANFSIHRWTGSTWQTMTGAATRIAVDSAGNAWVVNAAAQIYHWNGAAWDMMPGAATDIGAGLDGSVWVIGLGGGIYRWNGTNWTAVQGAASQIAVDAAGLAWVINSGGGIYHWTGSTFVPTPGSAADVGSGGTTWVVGTAPVPGGAALFRLNGGSFQLGSNSGGVRLSVSATNQVWFVNSSSGIFRSN